MATDSTTTARRAAYVILQTMLGGVPLGLWALAGAMIIVHAGSVITSERTRQTLDVLLATPMSGSQILREKLFGVQRLIHVLLIPFCTIFGFEIWWHQGSEYRWLHLGLSLGTLVAYLPFLKWLALGIGLRVRSQMKAVGLTFTLVAGWLLLPDVIRAILVTMAGVQVPGWCEALFALNPKVQIPAIEDLNISARMATAKMTREALVPFIVLTTVNLLLHTAAGAGYDFSLLRGVVDVNARQHERMVDKVRAAWKSGVSFDGPGGKVTSQPNMHLTKNVFIGETKADGQFKILKSFNNVYGEPWLKGKFKAAGGTD